MAKEKGIKAPLIESIEQSNEFQVNRAVEIIKRINPNKKIIIHGIAFKPSAPDSRGSSMLKLAKKIKSEIPNCELSYFDPNEYSVENKISIDLYGLEKN